MKQEHASIKIRVKKYYDLLNANYACFYGKSNVKLSYPTNVSQNVETLTWSPGQLMS